MSTPHNCKANKPKGPLVVNLDDGAAKDTVVAVMQRTGLNQRQFAKLMGIHSSTLCEWLGGKHPTPAWAGRCAVFVAVLCCVPISWPKPAEFLAK